MNGCLYKIRIVLMILLFALVFLPFQAVAAHGDGQGNTPQELMENGWICWYRFDQYAFCMNPAFGSRPLWLSGLFTLNNTSY